MLKKIYNNTDKIARINLLLNRYEKCWLANKSDGINQSVFVCVRAS